ncbi:hypothetical protein [Galactobacter caseinivorans]|uniref:Uncharacterized protein n=1 Tax=Galactobacter caseinivorans TaxID=2676123 RepID=A0A496PH66_9MICC|nr:hypothetical protein [Galactobacter caseinivorans]RKW69826.1 hypothetical protein DWQ67_10090 [Galactobacter caseinivorans]
MGLFSQLRAGKADDRELGHALWRADHDRFRRAVDRFHQVLEGAESNALYAQLLPQADRLGALIPSVREACVACQRLAPVEGDDVPGALEPAHRALSRAANEAATAAQAAAMARYSTEQDAVVATVTRRIGIVEQRVREALEASR